MKKVNVVYDAAISSMIHEGASWWGNLNRGSDAYLSTQYNSRLQSTHVPDQSRYAEQSMMGTN